MDRDQVLKVVCECVAVVLGVAEDELTENTHLRAEYDVDSLELTEMGARLESRFDIRLEMEDLTYFQTLGDVVARMQQRIPAEPVTA